MFRCKLGYVALNLNFMAGGALGHARDVGAVWPKAGKCEAGIIKRQAQAFF